MYDQLLAFGVTLFVDLTTPYEHRHLPFLYSHPRTMRFPIRDNWIPNDQETFRRFIVNLADAVKNHDGKIYIHCKGGHNRSGLVIASLMCFIDNMDPIQAMRRTAELHSARLQMKDKYRHKPCPDNYRQRQFLLSLFQPVHISSTGTVLDLIQSTGIRPVIADRMAKTIDVFLHLRQELYNYDMRRKRCVRVERCLRMMDK